MMRLVAAEAVQYVQRDDLQATICLYTSQCDYSAQMIRCRPLAEVAWVGSSISLCQGNSTRDGGRFNVRVVLQGVLPCAVVHAARIGVFSDLHAPGSWAVTGP